MAGPNVAQQRRQQALKLLGEGFGCTELTAKLSGEWGCSRRQARRYVAGAYSEMVNDLQHVEASDMLATIINRLEQVARLAIESLAALAESDLPQEQRRQKVAEWRRLRLI